MFVNEGQILLQVSQDPAQGRLFLFEAPGDPLPDPAVQVQDDLPEQNVLRWKVVGHTPLLTPARRATSATDVPLKPGSQSASTAQSTSWPERALPANVQARLAPSLVRRVRI